MIALEAYAADCRLYGLVDLEDGRLTDFLNASSEVRIREARLESLVDGHVVQIPEITLGRDELCAVVAHGHQGDGSRRGRTHATRFVVDLGPYAIVGFVHGPSAADPIGALLRRAPWVPLTDVTVTYRRGPDSVSDSVETLLVNRNLTSLFRAVEDRFPIRPLPEAAISHLPGLLDSRLGTDDEETIEHDETIEDEETIEPVETIDHEEPVFAPPRARDEGWQPRLAGEASPAAVPPTAAAAPPAPAAPVTPPAAAAVPPFAVSVAPTPTSPAVVAEDVPAVATAKARPIASAAASTPRRTVPSASAREAARPKPSRATTRRAPTRRRSRAKIKAVPAPAAFCPYCALPLEPPPTTSRRCVRCRQRIIVKRVDGRPVYLTEGAVLVFESERRREAGSGRLKRERERWLKLAVAAGAPAQKTERLAAASLTEKVVGTARALYVTSADRWFRAAKREHNWVAASRLRRDQATALYRAEGGPLPPPADLVAMYREGVAAELRGIAEISRDAELVSASCCDICRADHRKILRIAPQQRAPRLPHEGCPKGLCRCHWELAARDRSTMRRYLRRRPGTESRPADETATTG